MKMKNMGRFGHKLLPYRRGKGKHDSPSIMGVVYY
jgi:hypothetical protein